MVKLFIWLLLQRQLQRSQISIVWPEDDVVQDRKVLIVAEVEAGDDVGNVVGVEGQMERQVLARVHDAAGG
jgi:hypothetical protein